MHAENAPDIPVASTMPVYAAIDIGSNTIHVVVARCTHHDLTIVADELELVRIGESVTSTGAISPQKLAATLVTLQKYKALALQHGAQAILVVATEAIRRASNHADTLAVIQRETGLTVHLISGYVEATLTFWGATYEAQKDAYMPPFVGVMDLGGGSTELVMALRGQIAWSTSLPIGSGWLNDRYLPSSPPTQNEVSVARTFLQTYIDGQQIPYPPPVLIATGGSANSLLYLARRAFGLHPETKRFTHNDLLRCEGLLTTLSAEEVARRYGQPEARARILPAGLLIIQTVMERFHLAEMHVSPHGIREGMLLAYARYQEQWLERVAALTETVGDHTKAIAAYSTPFVKTARHNILERTHKLLSWREAVLKHDDVESVHKMRVATRRLRAALDAYEAICEPVSFKKAYRRVIKIADILGAARDMDVLILDVQSCDEQGASDMQAGTTWLVEHLKVYRQQRQRKLESFFKKFDERAFLHALEACLPDGEKA